VRRLLAVFGLVLAFATIVAPALAQPHAPPPAAPSEAPPGDLSARREPGKPEYMNSKPSGFGLPNVPAKGGAYRYRLLLVGVAVAAVTGFITVRYLRRISRGRNPPATVTSSSGSSGARS
jgi:hypothetical protein